MIGNYAVRTIKLSTHYVCDTKTRNEYSSENR